MPQSYSIDQIVEVEIQKVVPKGLGMAFLDGLTVFVPLSAPGDVLKVRLAELKGKVAFAEIVEVTKPSSERTEPPCPYFGVCGGCDFQQLRYDKQLEAKRGIILDALSRIGKIEYEDIRIIPSPKPLNYRARVQWHVDTSEGVIGYYRRNSHEVIDIEVCPQIVPELEATLRSLRGSLRGHVFTRDRVHIEAACGDSGEVSIYSDEFDAPVPTIAMNAAGERFQFSAQTFFQANRFMLGELIRAATEGARGQTALDLYCGVGLFAIPLARNFGRVIGVEGNRVSLEFARKNVEAAELDNVELVAGGVAQYLWNGEFESPDFILLDPPRAGTEKHAINNIIGLRAREVSYVSCEPSILARDLRKFLDAGYSIRSMTALDLFPQTHHVETVVRLGL